MWKRIVLFVLVACGSSKPDSARPVTTPTETRTEATTRLHRGTPTAVGTIEASFVSCTTERYTTSPDGPEKHAVDCEIQLSRGSHRESWRVFVEAPLEETVARRPATLERVFEGVRLRIVGLQVDRDPMHLDLEHALVR